jgi:hypothetical protein
MVSGGSGRALREKPINETVSIDRQLQTIGATEIHNPKKGEAGQGVLNRSVVETDV